MSHTWMILGMAAVTVFIKATIFVLGGRVTFPPLLQQALGFVPVTVLTAIIVPMVIAPHNEGLELTWRNPQLVASIIAILVCAATKKQLLTIAVALIAFFGWQFAVLGQ
ncbi:AzlD domain-containing protein [Noviherbaspirillum sp.]|uniref:AzlD domain-containing protein n=1 Tax=Noviherbaspirillum sp. TaxID=1926288 RepID=UPI002D48A3AC|nr:AzlD domain-containing protein [Noviherbaspirillum sp.]HZW21337.1 AzlD domain-containing protein [Noviherbaspirillum sp.]